MNMIKSVKRLFAFPCPEYLVSKATVEMEKKKAKERQSRRDTLRAELAKAAESGHMCLFLEARPVSKEAKKRSCSIFSSPYSGIAEIGLTYVENAEFLRGLGYRVSLVSIESNVRTADVLLVSSETYLYRYLVITWDGSDPQDNYNLKNMMCRLKSTKIELMEVEDFE